MAVLTYVTTIHTNSTIPFIHTSEHSKFVRFWGHGKDPVWVSDHASYTSGRFAKFRIKSGKNRFGPFTVHGAFGKSGRTFPNQCGFSKKERVCIKAGNVISMSSRMGYITKQECAKLADIGKIARAWVWFNSLCDENLFGKNGKDRNETKTYAAEGKETGKAQKIKFVHPRSGERSINPLKFMLS